MDGYDKYTIYTPRTQAPGYIDLDKYYAHIDPIKETDNPDVKENPNDSIEETEDMSGRKTPRKTKKTIEMETTKITVNKLDVDGTSDISTTESNTNETKPKEEIQLEMTEDKYVKIPDISESGEEDFRNKIEAEFGKPIGKITFNELMHYKQYGKKPDNVFIVKKIPDPFNYSDKAKEAINYKSGDESTLNNEVEGFDTMFLSYDELSELSMKNPLYGSSIHKGASLGFDGMSPGVFYLKGHSDLLNQKKIIEDTNSLNGFGEPLITDSTNKIVKSVKEYVNRLSDKQKYRELTNEEYKNLDISEVKNSKNILIVILNKTNQNVFLFNNQHISDGIIEVVSEILNLYELEYETRYFILKTEANEFLNVKPMGINDKDKDIKIEFTFDNFKDVDKLFDSFFDYIDAKDKFTTAYNKFLGNFIKKTPYSSYSNKQNTYEPMKFDPLYVRLFGKMSEPGIMPTSSISSDSVDKAIETPHDIDKMKERNPLMKEDNKKINTSGNNGFSEEVDTYNMWFGSPQYCSVEDESNTEFKNNFGTGLYLPMIDFYKKDGEIYTGNNIIVLFNTTNNTSICLKKHQKGTIDKALQVMKDVVFISQYEEMNTEQEKDIYNFYHQREFMDLDNLKEKARSFENIYEITNSDTVDELKDIKNIIRGYLRSNYIIDDNPKNIMKATSINERIEADIGSVVKDKVKFRWTLSNVLMGMNLKKKRLSDGIYYYGIIPKTSINDGKMEDEYKKRLEIYGGGHYFDLFDEVSRKSKTSK